MDDIEALTILSSTPMLGSVKIRVLLHRFGTALNAISCDRDELNQLPGFTQNICKKWGWWKTDLSWETNLKLVKQHNVKIVPYTSDFYPKRLLEAPDHPVLLYVMGELKNVDNRSLAIVGTRRPGSYGLAMAEKISGCLAASGFTIVSGLAQGIDTAAHRGALHEGRTLAVLGSGLANIYPRENQNLASLIANNGALISEFPMTAPPDRHNFPQRNRIVSGMTIGSILVEAPKKSGAMITMEQARKYGKRLFALPGEVGENFSGNHQLIKQGKAELIESAADIDEAFSNLFSLNVPQHNRREYLLENRVVGFNEIE